MLSLLLALAWAADPLPAARDVVERYRDALVLADAVPTLPEGQRRDAPILGKMLFADRRDAERALTETLRADVPVDKGDRGRDVGAFLDWLEGDTLRDGDKLAFGAVLDGLQRALAAAPAGKHRDRLLARVEADQAALDTVEARYRDEMRALFGRLRTRGMTLTREAWDAYLTALKADRDVAAIYARHAAELSLVVPGTRGLKDNPLEIYGTSLPPKTFVLTFDDGPHPERTEAVLDLLEDREVEAVSFQVGQNAVDHPAPSERVVDEGHLLGSHSWSHANLPKESDAGLDEQLDKAFEALDTASGEEVVLFRPPYGGRDGRVLEAIADRGTRAYLWNVDSMDWADPIPETVRGADAGLYGESWAVVIGINQYERWPRLAYPMHDAEGVRDALVARVGFEEDHVLTLFDGEATRDRILEVLGDELLGRVQPEDRVFVFYAGHGATRALPSGLERGYIVPVDGDTEKLQSTAISMSQLGDVHEALAAKHVMFVMDASYSGIALTRAGGYTGDPRRYLQEITRRSARQIRREGRRAGHRLRARGALDLHVDAAPGHVGAGGPQRRRVHHGLGAVVVRGAAGLLGVRPDACLRQPRGLGGRRVRLHPGGRPGPAVGPVGRASRRRRPGPPTYRARAPVGKHVRAPRLR